MISMANSTRRVLLSVLGVLLTLILIALFVFITSWVAPFEQTASFDQHQSQNTQIELEIVHEPLTTLAAAGDKQGESALDVLWQTQLLPYEQLGTDIPVPNTSGDSS